MSAHLCTNAKHLTQHLLSDHFICSESKALIGGKLDDPKATQQVIDAMPELISISLPYDTAPKCQYEYQALIADAMPSASYFSQ